MAQYLIKLFVSALIIVGVTELSKRSGPFWAGLLASLPLTSLMAFIWLHHDTHDSAAIASLSWTILWLVLPSITLFMALPLLLNLGFQFPYALAAALGIMIVSYLATAELVRRFGIHI